MYFNRRSINFSKRKVGEDIILPKKREADSLPYKIFER